MSETKRGSNYKIQLSFLSAGLPPRGRGTREAGTGARGGARRVDLQDREQSSAGVERR
jgi:hypothetical protein